MRFVRVDEDTLYEFYTLPERIYKGNTCYRSGAEKIVHFLVDKRSAFHLHATVIPFLIEHNNDFPGRFVFIQDRNMPGYIQVAFFEALPGLKDIGILLCKTAVNIFSKSKKILVGINGHLNYGAGILLNKFELPPVYEFPYNPPYYKDYFADFTLRKMISFRFRTEPFIKYGDILQKVDFGNIKVRKINKENFMQEIALYTQLNNACFKNHPYWTDRTAVEDYELFEPLQSHITPENLLFAEYDGTPVGFLLWFPDYYQNKKEIDTLRIMEIAVLPGFRVSRISQAMFAALIRIGKEYKKFKYCEGGFIFIENTGSMNLALKYLKRAAGIDAVPFREYGVFEKEL